MRAELRDVPIQIVSITSSPCMLPEVSVPRWDALSQGSKYSGERNQHTCLVTRCPTWADEIAGVHSGRNSSWFRHERGGQQVSFRLNLNSRHVSDAKHQPSCATDYIHGCNRMLRVRSHAFCFVGQSDPWSFHGFSDSPNRNYVFASVAKLTHSA
jgi:hypothetical protein